MKWKLRALIFLLLALGVGACYTEKSAAKKKKPRQESKIDPTLVMVTGYCNCEKCCGWKKSWFGLGGPVYTYGKMKGMPKKVGVTASGKVAKRGTIAADPKVYKFGTKLYVPGYGEGVVEDIGGAIKGRHIDIWFPTHAEARKWGVKYFRPEKLQLK